MTTLTGATQWAALADRLEKQQDLTLKMNAYLLRQMPASVSSKLGVTLSNKRLLFVPSSVGFASSSYAMVSFVNAEIYEFILVIDNKLVRSDRCSAAIRVDVLLGFLKDLISLTAPSPAGQESPTPPDAPPTQEPPAPALSDGWVTPTS